MSFLFSPLQLRGVTLPNRIAVSPMCQYSCWNGHATEWHLVHLGSRAVGGAGLVFTEAAAVEARGRISPHDLGIYTDTHIEPLRRVASFIREQGAVPGIQLAHAGRKASTRRPWEGGKPVPPEEGGWSPLVGPDSRPFDTGYQTPEPMTADEIRTVIAAFVSAAIRAMDAGFQVVEIHAAHGYLLHAFFSPLTNGRTDEYGGDYIGRTRLLREVATAVRKVWPDNLPLFVRLSATDWDPEGWLPEDSARLAVELQTDGVDLIDCSSGGAVPPRPGQIPVGPLYQAPLAAEVRRVSGVPTGAVGLITTPEQAESLLREGRADLILLGREMLRNPYWPRRAAAELGVEIEWPAQYRRARP